MDSSHFIDTLSNFEVDEFWWALKNSFLQSSLSALFSFVIGTVLFQGLQKARNWGSQSLQRWIEILLLMPNLMPSLLIVFLLIDLIEPFPIGMIGVVFVHSFMNAGLVAILLDRMLQNKALPIVEMAEVFGASKVLFANYFVRAFKTELLAIFAFIFIICFTSFTVPLLVGGGRATTLEILIFEKIKLTGEYNEALFLGLAQFALVAAMGILNLSQIPRQDSRSQGSHYFSSWWGLFTLLVMMGLPVIYFIFAALQGIESVGQIPGLKQSIFLLVLPSLFFSFLVSSFVVLLLLFLAFQFPQRKYFVLMNSFLTPSTAFVGLSFLVGMILLGISGYEWAGWVFWIIGFGYIIFPTLYRWGWSQELEGLRGQVEVANLLGASRAQIFFEVLLPQLAGRASLIASVAGFWALGDFALGKIFLAETKTLAMLSESLLSAYRIEAGLSIMGLILLLGLVQMACIKGVESVYRYWLKKKLLA